MKNEFLSIPEIIKRTSSAFDATDETRIQELERAKIILTTKHEMLVLESKRLAQKYGPAYKEVVDMEARVLYEKEMFKALDDEIEYSKARRPDFDVTGWRVEGYVFDLKGNKARNITLFLIDEQKMLVKELPHSISDEKGFYSITLDKKKINDMKDKKLLLAILSKDKKVIPVGPAPLDVMPGGNYYQDITLKVEPCTPSSDNGSGVVIP